MIKKLTILVLFILAASSCLFADASVELHNVFSTYKVGEYIFVARYGSDFNVTTPVYVGNMAVSENQTLDISGYRDSVGGTKAPAASSKNICNICDSMAYKNTAVQASDYTIR